MDGAGLLLVLPLELRINIADVGSAGSLHERWSPVRRHVSALFASFAEQSKEPGICLEEAAPWTVISRTVRLVRLLQAIAAPARGQPIRCGLG